MITQARKLELEQLYESEKEAVGVCQDCKEWTSIIEPCCGSAVYAEGDSHCREDVLDSIAESEEEFEYLEAL